MSDFLYNEIFLKIFLIYFITNLFNLLEKTILRNIYIILIIHSIFIFTFIYKKN
jgi:hypothetical protein